jgi:hypothetical protein
MKISCGGMKAVVDRLPRTGRCGPSGCFDWSGWLATWRSAYTESLPTLTTTGTSGGDRAVGPVLFSSGFVCAMTSDVSRGPALPANLEWNSASSEWKPTDGPATKTCDGPAPSAGRNR